MKRLWAMLLALGMCLALAGLAGCARTDEKAPEGPETPPGPEVERPEEPVELERFLLELRSARGNVSPDGLAALEPLGQKLQELLAEEGYVFDTVQITLGASPRNTGEALTGGTVDAALVNIETYIKYADGLPVLMTSAPDGVDLTVEGGSWSAPASEDQPGWRTVGIFASASDYGQALGKEKTPTFEELAQAVWAVPQEGRELDYLNLWLSRQYEGRTVADLPHVKAVAGMDEILLAAASGEVDVVVLTTGTVSGSDLVRLGESTRYYDMVLTVSDAQEALADEMFHSALCRAVTALCADEESMALLQTLGCAHPMTAAEEFDTADLQEMLEVMGGTLTCESWE